jgi:hypothetical protein
MVAWGPKKLEKHTKNFFGSHTSEGLIGPVTAKLAF